MLVLFCIAASLLVLFLCLLLHCGQHFKWRSCYEKLNKKKTRRKSFKISIANNDIDNKDLCRLNCCIGSVDDAQFDFYPISFALYILFISLISFLIIIRYMISEYSHLYHIHINHNYYPDNILFDISSFNAFTHLTRIRMSTYLDLIIYICIFISSIWECLFSFYRYYTTLLSATSFTKFKTITIIKSFSIYAFIFAILFFTQTLFYYWIFPLVFGCYFILNIYWNWKMAYLLLNSYLSLTESLQSDLQINNFHHEMIAIVMLMRNLSITSVISSSMYIGLFVLFYDMKIVYYFPSIWSVSTVLFVFNFVRNRKYIRSKLWFIRNTMKSMKRRLPKNCSCSNCTCCNRKHISLSVAVYHLHNQQQSKIPVMSPTESKCISTEGQEMICIQPKHVQTASQNLNENINKLHRPKYLTTINIPIPKSKHQKCLSTSNPVYTANVDDIMEDFNIDDIISHSDDAVLKGKGFKNKTTRTRPHPHPHPPHPDTHAQMHLTPQPQLLLKSTSNAEYSLSIPSPGNIYSTSTPMLAHDGCKSHVHAVTGTPSVYKNKLKPKSHITTPLSYNSKYSTTNLFPFFKMNKPRNLASINTNYNDISIKKSHLTPYMNTSSQFQSVIKPHKGLVLLGITPSKSPPIHSLNNASSAGFNTPSLYAASINLNYNESEQNEEEKLDIHDTDYTITEHDHDHESHDQMPSIKPRLSTIKSDEPIFDHDGDNFVFTNYQYNPTVVNGNTTGNNNDMLLSIPTHKTTPTPSTSTKDIYNDNNDNKPFDIVINMNDAHTRMQRLTIPPILIAKHKRSKSNPMIDRESFLESEYGDGNGMVNKPILTTIRESKKKSLLLNNHSAPSRPSLCKDNMNNKYSTDIDDDILGSSLIKQKNMNIRYSRYKSKYNVDNNLNTNNTGNHIGQDSAVIDMMNLFVLHGFCSAKSVNSVQQLTALTPSVSSRIVRKF